MFKRFKQGLVAIGVGVTVAFGIAAPAQAVLTIDTTSVVADIGAVATPVGAVATAVLSILVAVKAYKLLRRSL